MKWHPFVCAILLARCFAAETFYTLKDAGAPAGRSWAVDLNENGVLLGGFVSNDTARVFLSRNGVFETIDSPKDAFANGINNREEIVGSYLELITNPSGSSFWQQRAWHWNGTNDLIGARFAESSVATDINDSGVIVGSIGATAYVLAPVTNYMSPFTGGTPGPYPAESLDGINNSGLVIGNFGSGYRWHALRANAAERLLDSRAVFGVNDAGQIVGSGGSRLGFAQPAIWAGTNLTWLGAPIDLNGEGWALNANGVAVGALWGRGDSSNDGSAAIWWNGLGINLNSITDLPPDTSLLSAQAINGAGEIAATAFVNGTNRAVLLKPKSNPLTLGRIELVPPTDENLPTNIFTARISITNWPAPIASVSYKLAQRFLQPGVGGGDFYTPPRWTSWVITNRTSTNAPFELTFTDLPAGQWAVGASVRDARGLEVFTTPIFFTVTRPAVLVPIRVNMLGQFQFGFNGTPGYLQAIEESTDLKTWVPSQYSDGYGSGGAILPWPVNDAPRRFFRTRRASADPESVGNLVVPFAAPASLGGHTVRFYTFENSSVAEMRFGSNSVEVTTPDLSAFSGQFTYQPNGGRARLKVISPDADWSAELELEWESSRAPYPWEYSAPGSWRGTIGSSRSNTRSGRFFDALSGVQGFTRADL